VFQGSREPSHVRVGCSVINEDGDEQRRQRFDHLLAKAIRRGDLQQLNHFGSGIFPDLSSWHGG
jgi:hypothetical protein